MKILFKDNDAYVYFIGNDSLLYANIIEYFSDINLGNIPHLDDAEVLYHYRNIQSGLSYPVYYEHNGRIITEISNQIYYTTTIGENFIKDYTLVNLKLLEDGNII